MKAHDFQKLLFKSAVSIMAADGEIHETEVAELKTLVSESAYFLDFEFDAALNENLSLIKSDGKDSINSFLKDLAISELNKHQQLILVEVLFRIIDADNKIEENEIVLFQKIKTKLNITDEELILKFPKRADTIIDFKGYGKGEYFDIDININ
jgi:uncharacterized tellurite resistance protein B-like protein